MRARTAIFAAVALTCSAAPATQNVDTFKVPTFGQVAVYREQIRNPRARVVTVGAGHHFSGEYARLLDAILERR